MKTRNVKKLLDFLSSWYCTIGKVNMAFFSNGRATDSFSRGVLETPFGTEQCTIRACRQAHVTPSGHLPVNKCASLSLILSHLIIVWRVPSIGSAVIDSHRCSNYFRLIVLLLNTST